MRNLVNHMEADPEIMDLARECEAIATVREYLVLLAVKHTVEELERAGEKDPLGALKSIINAVLDSAEYDLTKHGLWLSNLAAGVLGEAWFHAPRPAYAVYSGGPGGSQAPPETQEAKAREG